MAGFLGERQCTACSGMHKRTLCHRHWECKVISPEREQGIAKEILAEALEALRQDSAHPLWTRGLLSLDQLPKPPPVGSDVMRFYRGADVGTLSGQVYTDGALKQCWWWKASERAGWGAVSLCGRRLSVAIYGPIPGPDQSVPRAELYAIARALRIAILPSSIFTDHYNIVLGFQEGKAVTTASAFPTADLWRLIWHHLADLGGLQPGLFIDWTPGHDSGLSFNALSNRWAHAVAKLGISA